MKRVILPIHLSSHVRPRGIQSVSPGIPPGRDWHSHVKFITSFILYCSWKILVLSANSIEMLLAMQYFQVSIYLYTI